VHVALATGQVLPDLAAAADAPLVAALETRRCRVSRPRWDDAAVDWAAADVVVVRTTWDYARQRDRFLAWAGRTAAVTRLWNPVEVLRWNTHKSYLLELEERGAPVVPTAWLGRGDRIDLGALLSSRGWSQAVVKPAVGASSEGLFLVDAERPHTGQRHLDALLGRGDVMIQPYLDTIERRGELSIVVIDGEVSHAIRKIPRPGEYRIQEEFGGARERVVVDREAATLARWVVEATGTELLFARIDLVEDATGTLQLAELEATEPDLYLAVVPGAADGLAEAIVRRAEGDPSDGGPLHEART
jgi:glutathione synthase/RimK-type ligase-like ATP-grasp enzyme